MQNKFNFGNLKIKGIQFADGQTIQRSDDDECEVQNNVDACTNYLLHDTLRSG